MIQADPRNVAAQHPAESAMTTELDELVTRAANDASIADAGVNQAILKAIETTRRHWLALADEQLALDAVIGVGVGYAALTCDGVVRYEQNGKPGSGRMTAAQAEELAKSEPDRDWRIHLVALLDDRHYRRAGAARWVLYERGYGMS
jgi:hypothetical protein